MMRVAIAAALPEEYGPLRKRSGPWETVARDPFRIFRCLSGQKELILLETGMGREAILSALDHLEAWRRPDLLVSIGFAGGLAAGHEVGRVFLAASTALWRPEASGESARSEASETAVGRSAPEAAERAGAGETPEEDPITTHLSPTAGQHSPPVFIRFRLPDPMVELARTQGIGIARFVTTPTALPKPLVRRHLSAEPTLADMESWHIAHWADTHRIPLVILRAVSDGPDDEIGFDPMALADARGRIQIARVLRQIRDDPRLIRKLLASWQRSRTAARRLAPPLAALLELPAEVLSRAIPAHVPAPESRT